jgi:hypothetical protein
MRRFPVIILSAVALLRIATPAFAGCGCDKPPPPRAAVRPFVGYPDQKIALFDDRLTAGQKYDVLFESTVGGDADWSRGRATVRRDLADGKSRAQLRVPVGTVSMGPCRISVWDGSTLLMTLGDEAFTVTAPPIALHDFSESVGRDAYRAGVGRDGTIYIPVDVSQVSDATTFTGQAWGLPVQFQSWDVAMYNEQGFLMQLLDPKTPGLFSIDAGSFAASSALRYWRHEFRTYKRDHRQLDARRFDDDPDWHADGSYHVDHDHIVVAVHGTLPDGGSMAPGSTPPFWLGVSSAPAQSAAAVQ